MKSGKITLKNFLTEEQFEKFGRGQCRLDRKTTPISQNLKKIFS